ncbi:MAG: TonB-dependent receptor plug domain-containing protein [Schwartzia sp. (in: firmicutes)]
MNRKQKRLWMAVSLSLCTACPLTVEAAGNESSGGGQTEAIEEYALDDIVVTATRTPVEAFKANANINVVTRDMIEKRHYTSVQEALRDVPGVSVPIYGNSGETYSANGLMLNGTDHVVVLIDGVRANINGSSGTYGKMPMAELSNMASIERIEVLKSSASTLYGADAAGGVINIITRDPAKEKMRTTLSALRGSFGKEQYNLSHRGSKDGFYWDISLQKKSTDNFKDGWGREIADQLNSTNNTYKIGKRFGDTADVNVVYQTYTSNYLRPTGGWSDLVKDKKWGQYNTGEKNNTKLTVHYRQKFGDHAENQLSVFRYQHRQDELAWQKKHKTTAYTAPAIYHYSTIGLSDQFNFRIGAQHRFVAGGEWYRDKTDEYNYAGTIFTGKDITTAALYLHDTFTFGDDWELSYGVRYNHNSRFGSAWLPSVTLGHTVKERLNYFVGYKRFFIAPYMSQLFSPKYGDPDLNASTGTALEAGVNYRFNPRTVGSMKLFRRWTKDAFGYDPGKIAPMSGNVGAYANYGEENARGFDLQMKTYLGDGWTASAAYTYTYVEAVPGKGAAAVNERVPRSAWNIGIDYEKGKFNANLTARASIAKSGSRSGAQAKSNTSAAAADYHTFWLFDVGMNYCPVEDVNFFVRCNNLFNRLYTEQSYELDPNKAWYSGPGRRFEVGVEYSF